MSVSMTTIHVFFGRENLLVSVVMDFGIMITGLIYSAKNCDTKVALYWQVGKAPRLRQLKLFGWDCVSLQISNCTCALVDLTALYFKLCHIVAQAGFTLSPAVVALMSWKLLVMCQVCAMIFTYSNTFWLYVYLAISFIGTLCHISKSKIQDSSFWSLILDPRLITIGSFETNIFILNSMVSRHIWESLIFWTLHLPKVVFGYKSCSSAYIYIFKQTKYAHYLLWILTCS